MKVGLIGVGSIGGYLLQQLHQGVAGPVEIVGVADIPASETRLRQCADTFGCRWTTNPLELVDWGATLVVEAASQAAARQHALALLERGADVLVMSVGALVEPTFHQAVFDAAVRTHRHVYVPSGAVGGLDVLRAAAIDQLDEVTLTTSKHPRALEGAPFFERQPFDLAAIDRPTVLFDGSAGEAVSLFPANVNVAAAVSLAGLGPQRTRMQVVADPSLDRNQHELAVRGSFGDLYLRLTNVPSPSNPRTSQLACLSALSLVKRFSEPIQIG